MWLLIQTARSYPSGGHRIQASETRGSTSLIVKLGEVIPPDGPATAAMTPAAAMIELPSIVREDWRIELIRGQKKDVYTYKPNGDLVAVETHFSTSTAFRTTCTGD
jgi:hypothetical protein